MQDVCRMQAAVQRETFQSTDSIVAEDTAPAGWFLTKQGPGRARIKRYLYLFLCLQTQSCHLEIVWSLEPDGFLQFLTRMAARRGWPRDMSSDNGTNFVGGSNELRKLVDQIDQARVESLTSNQGMNWHCNPPASPHFGGVLQRLIKAAKSAIEANLRMLKSMMKRLLTQVSRDPNNDSVFTPNPLLIGKIDRCGT